MAPPFMNSTGLISKIFEKIATAQRPERFTQDFLGSVLGFGSGSARPAIPLLKRLNFLQSDGTPTSLYAKFRNPSERASAMMEGLRSGYPEVFARNEFAHVLPKEKFRDLVVEVTGMERDSSTVTAIVGTFQALKTIGGVNDATKPVAAQPDVPPPAVMGQMVTEPSGFGPKSGSQEFGMNLSYTINLNLPPSPDPEVFNAIFKSLREHLLGK